ncbi:MAG: hypothetical protein J5985_02340, partial [Kiritimatiellae bacterium]|nr:hypothetical protein [Kiritimatiellia bacterium]
MMRVQSVVYAAFAAIFATSATMASISDLDSQKYRWDFSKGAYSYIGNGTDPLVEKNASYPSTFKSTEGPNGKGSAVYVDGTTWGEAFGTNDSPTDLNAHWTLAMCFRPGELDNGIALSMGRLNVKNRKEIALCSSSDPSKFYI